MHEYNNIFKNLAVHSHPFLINKFGLLFQSLHFYHRYIDILKICYYH